LKENKKIFLIGFILFLIGTVGGLYYFVKTQIRPDEIKLAIKEKIERSLPGTEVSLGELTVKYGPSLYLKIKGMDILLKKELFKRRDFIQVNEIEVKLPIWSLITGGGNLEVNLIKPEVYLLETDEKKSNWSQAISEESKSVNLVNKEKPSVDKTNIILPAFLVSSTLALRLNDLKVYYDIQNKIGVWSASKMILKNLGLSSNAAFEVQSNFKRVKNDKEVLSLDTVLVGSIEFSKYLKTGHLNINSSYKIKNLKYVGIPEVLPTTRGDISVSLSKSGLLKGDFKAVYKSSELKSNFLVDEKGDAELDNFELKLALGDFNDLWKSLGQSSDLTSASGVLKGRLEYKDKRIIPRLTYKITNFYYPLANESMKLSFGGVWDGDSIQNLGSIKTLGGEVKYKSEVTFALNSNEAFEKRLSHYTADLELNQIKISKKLFNHIFATSKLPVKEKDNENPNKKQDKFFLLPKGLINITLNSVVLGNQTLDGGATFKTDKNRFSLVNGVLLNSEGKLKISAKGKVFNDLIEIKHDLTFKNWSTATINGLIDKGDKSLLANLDGRISGKYLFPDKSKNSYKVDLITTKGHFLNYDLNDTLKSFHESFDDSLWGKDMSVGKLANGKVFKRVRVKATFKRDEHHFNTIEIKTDECSFDISGFVDPVGKKRKRLIVLVKGEKKLDNFLKRKTKLKSFPIGFNTYGYKFELDELYHLKKLSKKLRFKKDRAMVNKKILEVRTRIKGQSNEKS